MDLFLNTAYPNSSPSLSKAEKKKKELSNEIKGAHAIVFDFDVPHTQTPLICLVLIIMSQQTLNHHSHSHSHSHAHGHSDNHSHSLLKPSNIGVIRANPHINPIAVIMAFWQFILGSALWVAGQQIGSLACTGLGYWVVFDAFGIAIGRILPSYLSKPSMKDEKRRMYGYV